MIFTPFLALLFALLGHFYHFAFFIPAVAIICAYMAFLYAVDRIYTISTGRALNGDDFARIAKSIFTREKPAQGD